MEEVNHVLNIGDRIVHNEFSFEVMSFRDSYMGHSTELLNLRDGSRIFKNTANLEFSLLFSDIRIVPKVQVEFNKTLKDILK